MRGNGGRFYWGRKERRIDKGIVVLFAWLSSEERNLKPFIDLYGSLGWSSLVCHVDLLTLISPEKATSLASGLLNELLQEVNIRPLPIVLTSFSGGSKGCLYKVLQLVEGKCEGQLNKDEYQLVRECICGQVYDSSPVDFTSELVLKTSQPPRVVSLITRGIASCLDTLFLKRFESQRAEYWQTLYSSVKFGPFLLLCSEDDDLAPYRTVCNFAQRLQELGGDVKLLKWNTSPHIAHYKHHHAEYKAAVAEFLTKAAIIYSHRRNLEGETTSDDLNESNLHKAAIASNEGLAIDPSDDFFLPSSMEFNETIETVSSVAEQSINPQGVLSQIMYDVCVPKNIEGWDIKPGMSLKGNRTSAFNPLKFIRRSRL